MQRPRLRLPQTRAELADLLACWARAMLYGTYWVGANGMWTSSDGLLVARLSFVAQYICLRLLERRFRRIDG